MSLSDKQIADDVARALAEDIGGGDVTAELVAADRVCQAELLTREPATLCGRAWFDACFHQLDNNLVIDWQFDDGDAPQAGDVLCRITGPARAILTAERSALNFLQTLSGVATETQRYVKAVSGTGAKILDTRKTIPGLRLALKYAVRCGGGHNHRMGLYDAWLIKENHLAAFGSIEAAINEARQRHPDLPVIVEAENPAQLDEALNACADVVLIDNFDLAGMRAAVARRDALGSDTELEASGNIDLENLRRVAETGVDRISIGALTKHLRAIDLSLRVQDDARSR